MSTAELDRFIINNIDRINNFVSHINKSTNYTYIIGNKRLLPTIEYTFPDMGSFEVIIYYNLEVELFIGSNSNAKLLSMILRRIYNINKIYVSN
jgi:hypothetical protein